MLNKIDLKIGGFTPFTTIDFPNHLSAIIFCQGCLFSCAYCHNQQLLASSNDVNISWDEVDQFLQQRHGFLEAVVFSGGEPLMQSSLKSAIVRVKQMGFKVGLHTNGYFTARLQEVLALVDWIGFDVKAPFDDYAVITGIEDSGIKAKESIKLIITHKIPCSFRTTVHSALLSETQILTIGNELKKLGVNSLTLQKFRAEGCNDFKLISTAQSNYPSTELIDAVNAIFNFG